MFFVFGQDFFAEQQRQSNEGRDPIVEAHGLGMVGDFEELRSCNELDVLGKCFDGFWLFTGWSLGLAGSLIANQAVLGGVALMQELTSHAASCDS